MPRSLSRHANRPRGETKVLEFVPRPTCKHCGKPMKIESRTHPRHLVGTRENYEIVMTYYRCGQLGCVGEQEPTIHPENPHAPPRSDYDYDVIAEIVEMRWKRGLSYDKIVEAMKKEHGVIINHSAIENFLKIYEIGCAGKYKPEYVDEIRRFGGIILTLDAMKPLNGERALYVARDHRTGLVLGSRLLSNQKQETIEDFLRAVQERVKNELNVPMLGIISDALVSQRLAIESIFPDVPHCLCHYHFYNLVLLSSKKGDSHLVTRIRKELRGSHDVRKFKDVKDSKSTYLTTNPLLVSMMKALLALSNWSRKPRDPCFTGLELWKRVNDMASLVKDTSKLVGKGTFSLVEEKLIQRVNDVLESIIDENKELATDLLNVRDVLSTLQAILSNDEVGAEQGLEILVKFSKDASKRKRLKGTGQLEKEFIDALNKFVSTKGEQLFNYKKIDGAPRTNNSHELFYKQLKHLLRKVIGFSAASSFLIGHGERIVYVKPDDPFETIKGILMETDFNKARMIIASERKSRDGLSLIMHDDDKWGRNMDELRRLLHELEERGK